MVAEERSCLAATVPETVCAPADFPPSELDNLYSSTESGFQNPHLPTQFSVSDHDPGPVWLDYNTHDYVNFWSSAPISEQGILPPGGAVALQPISEVPYYAEYAAEEQQIFGTDLDASWQNFMQAYFQPVA